MVLVGPRVVGAWELNTISGYSPEIIAFDPTPTRDAANLVTASQPPAADLWAFQYLTLVPDAAGNPLLVVHGTKTAPRATRPRAPPASRSTPPTAPSARRSCTGRR